MKNLLIAFVFTTLSIGAYASEPIIPLQVGNYWKFSSSNGGVEYARILEEVSIDGKKWFKYRELSDDDIFYVNNSTDGQIEIDDETLEIQLVLKYPVSKETIYSQYGVKTSVKPNVEVTVPAGTFTAYLYNFSVEEPEDQVLIWFVPGLGPVKNIYAGVTYELVEFNIQQVK